MRRKFRKETEALFQDDLLDGITDPVERLFKILGLDRPRPVVPLTRYEKIEHAVADYVGTIRMWWWRSRRRRGPGVRAGAEAARAALSRLLKNVRRKDPGR